MQFLHTPIEIHVDISILFLLWIASIGILWFYLSIIINNEFLQLYSVIFLHEHKIRWLRDMVEHGISWVRQLEKASPSRDTNWDYSGTKPSSPWPWKPNGRPVPLDLLRSTEVGRSSGFPFITSSPSWSIVFGKERLVTQERK